MIDELRERTVQYLNIYHTLDPSEYYFYNTRHGLMYPEPNGYYDIVKVSEYATQALQSTWALLRDYVDCEKYRSGKMKSEKLALELARSMSAIQWSIDKFDDFVKEIDGFAGLPREDKILLGTLIENYKDKMTKIILSLNKFHEDVRIYEKFEQSKWESWDVNNAEAQIPEKEETESDQGATGSDD